MFRHLARAFRHTFTLLGALPVSSKRKLMWQMMAFSRSLPPQFDQPLPQMMAQLTPPSAGRSEHLADYEGSAKFQFPRSMTEAEIRHIADAVAAWHFMSPLGICLRRSLLRYHFLRAALIPVTIVFGARLKDSSEGGGIGGHAWLTLDGAAYYEQPEDYEGFVQMYAYPAADTSQPNTQNLNPKSNSG